MSPRFDLDDEQFLTQLRAVAAAEDQVPSSVLDFARLAPSIVSFDVALSELLSEESLGASSGLRDSDEGRRYCFALGESLVSVEVAAGLVIGEFEDDQGWSAQAQYDGHAVDLDIQEGVFVFAPEAKRFLLRFVRGEAQVATEWIRS